MSPSIRSGFILALTLSGAAFAAKPPAAPAPPSFGETVEINVVNVDVDATDKSGQRVTDLQKGDFQLLEDGKPVEITHFASIRPPAAATPVAAPATPPGAVAPPSDPPAKIGSA